MKGLFLLIMSDPLVDCCVYFILIGLCLFLLLDVCEPWKLFIEVFGVKHFGYR